VGILLGGRLVEERILCRGQDLSVGTSHRCAVVVPSSALPRRWRLFRWRGGDCDLQPHVTMTGRLASGQATVALRRGQTTSLPLGVRGKLSVGELTVLFQMLALPTLPRPRLPASLRGSVFGMVDRPYAGILVASLVAHLAFALQLRRLDWPKTPEYLADDFKQVFARRPLPAPAPVPAGSAPATESTASKAKAQPEARVARRAAASTDARRAQLSREVNKIGLLAVLTAKNADMDSAMADLLGDGAVERSQEAALAGVNAVGLASSADRLALHLGSGAGKIMNVRGLASGGVGIATADIGARDERRVARISTEQALIDSDPSGHLDAGQLTREIRSRLGALRVCYERSLKRNPSLAGKLLLHLTIAPAGMVSRVEVSSDSLEDSELPTCVRAAALRWRFPAPEGGTLEVSFPFVFQSAG
jgi:hypothetical protein